MNDIGIKIIIESTLVNLPIVRKVIRAICSSAIQEERVFQDIDLCLNEALSNIIYHAYHNEPGHEIQILVALYPNEVVFQITDSGSKNISLDEYALPDSSVNNINSLSETGRGLFIIHKLMDEVSYKREQNKNVLLLRKRFC